MQILTGENYIFASHKIECKGLLAYKLVSSLKPYPPGLCLIRFMKSDVARKCVEF